jgi:uracil phosphoribosyltransferase
MKMRCGRMNAPCQRIPRTSKRLVYNGLADDIVQGEHAMPALVHVSRHPLVLARLTQLRHKETPSPAFRKMVRELAQILFYEATSDLALEQIDIPTPLAQCVGHQFADRIGIVPILRAGLGMAEAILELAPQAGVWHIGMYRDHQTSQPVLYYNPLPEAAPFDVAMVVDPMLATGGSAVASIGVLKRAGLERIKFLGLIAAPEGVRALQDAHPDVPIYLAALDSHLDGRNYIVPGLGDAGDRQFGTARV